ncbi:hypothetical protein M3J07_001069 [Ascochyta lentis]
MGPSAGRVHSKHSGHLYWSTLYRCLSQALPHPNSSLPHG